MLRSTSTPTEFDGPDCEYVDGEIIERNMGQYRHGNIQLWVGILLGMMAKRIGLKVSVEVRIKISESRYRIPDLIGLAQRGRSVGCEILSPTDQPIETFQKIQEYLAAGIEWIWVIDPYKGRAMVYSYENPAGETVTVLRTEAPAIKIPLSKALNPRI
ncbi:MAG: Uma2 family endonuclease [Bryobacteraceae bacterium]